MSVRLRVLLVTLAAALGLLVARIEYLKGWAIYHQQEAKHFADCIATYRNVTPVEVEAAIEVASANQDDDRLDRKFHAVFHHRAAADAYQRTVYRPWMLVSTPTLPESSGE
ncbi:MAG: hypothetical protein K8R36_15050 [Planctomycetales bacterium]|nr:hypothetical protein [Planctomycetales bacterium]